MNNPMLNPTCEMPDSDTHPSDKEIALLAFKHWKAEGCMHLRPEHWLTAEKELKAAYQAPGQVFASIDSERLEDFWEQETETISAYATMNNELTLETKGWS